MRGLLAVLRATQLLGLGMLCTVLLSSPQAAAKPSGEPGAPTEQPGSGPGYPMPDPHFTNGQAMDVFWGQDHRAVKKVYAMARAEARSLEKEILKVAKANPKELGYQPGMSVADLLGALNKRGTYTNPQEVIKDARKAMRANAAFAKRWGLVPANTPVPPIEAAPPNSPFMGMADPVTGKVTISVDKFAPKRHEQAALTGHEAYPGHVAHFRAIGLGNLPEDPTKIGGSAALVEGWATYAEGLRLGPSGKMSPLDKVGELTHQYIAATTLVVDSGLMAKRMTPQSAKAYLAERGSAPKEMIDYLVGGVVGPMKGYTGSYYYGAKQLRNIRTEVRRTLGMGKGGQGRDFPLPLEKKFTQALLKSLMPGKSFSTVEKEMKAWAREQKKKPSQKPTPTRRAAAE